MRDVNFLVRNYYRCYRTVRNARYWCLDWLHPYNRIKVRNCPHTWTDRSDLAFHAIFTIMCEFVEKEHDGWKEYVKWVKESTDIPSHQYETAIVTDKLYNWYTSIDWKDPIAWPDGLGGSCIKEIPILDEDGKVTSYKWESSRSEEEEQKVDDWIKKSREFEHLCQRNLERAISVRNGWWA